MTKYAIISVGVLLAKHGFADPRVLTPAHKRTLEDSTLLLSRGMKRDISKEQYLEWVAAWKKLYEQVSIVIRNLKSYRDGKVPDVGGNLWESIRPYRQADVEAIRRFASFLLELRAINKILAGRARELAYIEREAEKALAELAKEDY